MKDNYRTPYLYAGGLLLLSGLYQCISFCRWLIEYVNETGFSFYSELFPLLMNSLYLLLGLVVIYIGYKSTHISKKIFWIVALVAFIIASLCITSAFSKDPLEAGLFHVILGMPAAIVLPIYLFTNKRRLG